MKSRRESPVGRFSPQVSLVMPVWNPQPAWLHQAVDARGARWMTCLAKGRTEGASTRHCTVRNPHETHMKDTHRREMADVCAALASAG